MMFERFSDVLIARSPLPHQIVGVNNPATPPVVDTTWSDEQIQTLMTQQWNLFASAFVPAAAPPLTLAAPPVPPVKR